jgi:hypothetical protein
MLRVSFKKLKPFKPFNSRLSCPHDSVAQSSATAVILSASEESALTEAHQMQIRRLAPQDDTAHGLDAGEDVGGLEPFEPL